MAALTSLTQLSSGNPIFENLYRQVDPGNTGRVGPTEAALFLKKSGLPDITLGKNNRAKILVDLRFQLLVNQSHIVVVDQEQKRAIPADSNIRKKSKKIEKYSGLKEQLTNWNR